MNIRGLLFDFDGLLVDTETPGRRSWEEIYREHGHDWDLIVAANGDRDRAKPRPDLYLEALLRLGIRADEAIAFEDSPNGLRAAKGAGIYCVAVPNPVTATLAFDEADLVLESLADVPLEDLLERL